MRRLTATRISPGAETCIVVGELGEPPPIDLRSFRSVLWFTRHGGARPAPHVSVEAVEPAHLQHTAASLDAFIRRDALRLPSIYVTDEVNGAAAPSFLPVIDTIFEQFESHQRARTTRQKDSFTWQKHLLTNLPAYARRRVPPEWAGALAGQPAFICGAGPSLDASIHALKKAAGHAVVFAADSALRALGRAGVTADFVLSVDAGKSPAKCLPPEVPLPGRVVLAGVSPPAWTSAVPVKRLFFLSGRQITDDWLAALGIARTAIRVEENCGITALALALHLGCGPIFLFGMDHAVDSHEPTRWHEGQGDIAADEQDGLTGRSPPKVPGNYQEEIATPLFHEWKALDEMCFTQPEHVISNVTDRGARFRNTTVVRPDAFTAPGTSALKSTGLATLAQPAPLDDAAAAQLAAALCDTAHRAGPMLAAARSALAKGQISQVVQALACAFRDRDIGRLFGNFGLKVMPHLVQAGTTDPAIWPQILDECEALLALVCYASPD